MACENLGHPAWPPAAATDLDQRPNDRPHHFIQEPIGLELNDQQRRFAGNPAGADRAGSRAIGHSPVIGILKCGIIVPADQMTGRRSHPWQ